MKICIYAHSLTGGGMERVAAILATELSHRRHQITLLVDHDKIENRSYVSSDVRYSVLPGRSRLARLMALISHFSSVPYDVVHTIAPALTLVALIARAVSKQRFFIVGACHGTFGISDGKLARLCYFLMPILTRAADRTVCVSNWMKEYLIHCWWAKAEQLVTIYNPVFTGMEDGTADTKKVPDEDYILFVSRLIRAKDPLLAIDGFALLPERLSHYKLVILGEGPYASKMLARAEECGIRNRVIYAGYTSHPWEFYRRAKVLIVTSKRETFSLVLVEALAHGVPVVAVDRGASREILMGGRYGALVPVGDVTAFARAIETTLHTPPHPELLQSRAADFSVGAAANAYERLFNCMVPN